MCIYLLYNIYLIYIYIYLYAIYIYICTIYIYMYTLPETNIASENQWLENEISYWGPAYFQGLGSVYFRDWKARRNRHTAKFFDFSLTK